MMKAILCTVVLAVITCNHISAQTAATIKDSVEVKKNQFSVNAALYLPKGTIVKSRQNTIGEWTLFDKGWIKTTDVLFLNENPVLTPPRIPSTNGYAQSLIDKAPEELTEKEIAYLMFYERKKDDGLRSDIKTIKNIQVAYAVLTAISIVSAIVIAS